MIDRHLPAAILGMMLAMPAAAAGQELSTGSADDAGAVHDSEDRLGLADLAAYRAALAGKATSDEARPSDLPARVEFRELWARPESYRGRRVIVRGRVERSFRQGAVGSFPPLVEAWVFTTTGDPLCIVYPRAGGSGGGPDARVSRDPGSSSAAGPAPASAADAGAGRREVRAAGQAVEFTGTFLKMVRYTAGDGDRLAPLIVGDRPPGPAPAEAGATPPGRGDILRAIGGDATGARDGRASWSRSSWILGLVMTAAAVAAIAAQHLRGTRLRDRAAARARHRNRELPDLPLHFHEDPAGPTTA